MQLRDHATFYKTQNHNITKQFSLLDIFGVLKNALLDTNTDSNHLPIRQLLDQDLKFSCEQFIQLVVNGCISNFIKLRDSLQNIRVGTPVFISPEEFVTTFENETNMFKANLEPAIVKLKQYLGDKQTQITLLRIIRGTILNQIKSYLDLVGQFGAKDAGSESEAAQKLDEAFKLLI